jgi:hypothetical protein
MIAQTTNDTESALRTATGPWFWPHNRPGAQNASSAGCSCDVGRHDVGGVTVEGNARPVVSHCGARIGVGGSLLHVPERHADVEAAVMNAWRKMCGPIGLLTTPALTAVLNTAAQPSIDTCSLPPGVGVDDPQTPTHLTDHPHRSALGGNRTPNLLIRSLRQSVHKSPSTANSALVPSTSVHQDAGTLAPPWLHQSLPRSNSRRLSLRS